MAANKFATILRRNTNKITLILIYAVLEWILILLLLLNSMFSYLIIKFAEYFGLKPPCIWCSRVDHFFEPAKGNNNFHRDLLCEVHSKEISKLGFCSNHQKLVDSRNMCVDCLSPRPEFDGVSKNFTLFPWMKEGANGEVSLECSCCGVISDNNINSLYKVVNPSWDVLECAHKENLIQESAEGYKSYGKISDFVNALCDFEHGLENKNETQTLSDLDRDFSITEKEKDEGYISVSVNELKEFEDEEDKKFDVVLETEEEKQNEVPENLAIITMEDKSVQVSIEDNPSLDTSPQHLEFFLDHSGLRLVPIELIDSITDEEQSKNRANEEDYDNSNHQQTSLDSEVGIKEDRFRQVEMEMIGGVVANEDPVYSELDSMEIEEDENSLVFHPKECHSETGDCEQDTSFRVARNPSKPTSYVEAMTKAEEEKMDSLVLPVCKEVARLSNSETEADVSIGTEIPDLDITDEIQNEDSVPSNDCTSEDPLTLSSSFTDDYHCPLQVQEENIELRSLMVPNCEHTMIDQPAFHLQLNDVYEDRVPDTPASTPTSLDNLHHLHKKFPLLEKKDSGTEESLDGSVTSELEGGDGVVTVEHLKSALRSERKTLQALYAELEEERSASAVAANQTMAMINRLQEEKAAMQMEALQYQRMMEEQSEYDQEALQLLNELMVKREKEKQELEKELEIYRKKVFDCETKEKIRILRKSKDGSTRSGFSSASCSNAEDSDGLSIDLNQEAKGEESFYSHIEVGNHNTPVDAALNLDESLANFEQERLSILEQLKVLEEKLMTMDIQEEQRYEDVRHMEDFHEENGNHVDEHGYFNDEGNGHANGIAKEMNVKHHQQRRIAGSKGKWLLPLFDATGDENGDALLNANGNGFESDGMRSSHESKLELDNKKLAIEEEVEHLYERLLALEADREFLKHCISSLRKGDKGMDLLQEILQHLRDLRNVELRVRNLSDTATV